MQIVLVYLQPLSRNLLLKCALQLKIAKKITKFFFGGSRSFNVIFVYKSKKPVTTACYHTQHVTYLQPFSLFTL